MITNKEKEASIAYILEKGLVQPKSVGQQILELYQQLGFRYLFWDDLYCLFFSIVTLSSVFVTMLFIPYDYQLSFLMVSAPFLYLILTFFSEISERLSGLYELKQTFHYTIFQLTAFRILFHALLGFILTTGLVFFTMKGSGEWLLALALSFLSLSLCTVTHLFVLRWVSQTWNVFGFLIIWSFLFTSFPLWFGLKKWESLLNTLPLWSLLIGILLVLWLFIYQIKIMLQEVQQVANIESGLKKIW